jgi:hypothetical protein
MEAGGHTDALEHELVRDLGELRDDLREDAFARELYRGLSSHRLTRLGNADGALSLSWRRAEEIVNGLRERAGAESLTLAQTGGEGELSDRVASRSATSGGASPRSTRRGTIRTTSPSRPLRPRRARGSATLRPNHRRTGAMPTRRPTARRARASPPPVVRRGHTRAVGALPHWRP